MSGVAPVYFLTLLGVIAGILQVAILAVGIYALIFVIKALQVYIRNHN